MKYLKATVLSLFVTQIMLFTGCSAVQETAKSVISDTGVQTATNVLATAVVSAATLSNPEIVAVATAVSALVGAIVAYRKKPATVAK